jgi:hypothetical protein
MTAPGTGHVAPDFEKPATHFNTLRIAPEYRIALRLSDLEELFPKQPDTPAGKRTERMHRMQALGLFYFPLAHNKANDRFANTWDWFKTKILAGATDDQADQALKRGLKSRIISGATLPGWDAGPSALPPDAADPANPAAANFAKIRVPGGYTFSTFSLGRKLNDDTNYPKCAHGNSIFDVEEYYYRDNVYLGKLPFIAKVEKRLPGEEEWKPAKDVTVLFQLVKPYADDKPAYDAGVAASGQFARPPLRATLGDRPDSGSNKGPKKMVDGLENHHVDAHDPQGKNCHKDRGGKRGNGDLNDGSDVDGQLFLTTSTPGFNAKHSDTQAMTHKDLEVAARMRPVSGKHKHAVKAKTNEDGDAGVIFTPSRMGGDRYRLRAYIGPPSQESDGEQVGSVAVTTGTFVVWRNIRISRVVKHDATDPPDSRMVEQVLGAPADDAKNKRYLKAAALVGKATAAAASETYLGFDTVDFVDPSAGTAPFESIPTQFAHAFCEVEMDTGSTAAETLSQADWDAARASAVADAKLGATALSLTLDCDQLFWTDITPSVADTVTHVPLRTPAAYNTAVGVASPNQLTINAGTLDPTQQSNIGTLLWFYVTTGFMRSLSKDGALPGLTLIYGGFGNTWQIMGLHARNSGIALDYRAACVWEGSALYPPRDGAGMVYNFSSNAIHELGHTMFRKHAPGRVGASVAGGNDAAVHDPIADCICVMSYDTCVGQFCGRCLVGFRGWKPV